MPELILDLESRSTELNNGLIRKLPFHPGFEGQKAGIGIDRQFNY